MVSAEFVRTNNFKPSHKSVALDVEVLGKGEGLAQYSESVCMSHDRRKRSTRGRVAVVLRLID